MFRIFDRYSFNIIDKVAFKETFDFVNKMLHETGFSYKEVLFYGCLYGKTIKDKILKKYPLLEKYIFNEKIDIKAPKIDFSECSLTSVGDEWENGKIYADKEDWLDIFDLSTKVPRLFNFGLILILDQVDWTNSEVKYPAQGFFCKENKLFSENRFNNNCIIMKHQFDDGKKNNSVEIVIETEMNGSSLYDTEKVIRELQPYLGEPLAIQREVIFDEKTTTCYDESIRLLTEELNHRLKTAYSCGYENIHEPYLYKICDKSKLKKAFNNSSFKLTGRRGLLPGSNRLRYLDKYNYTHELLLDRTMSTPNCFYFYYYIKGYNFRITSYQNLVFIDSEEKALEKLSELVRLCEQIKTEMGEKIFNIFGETPEWFYVNQNNSEYGF